MNMKACDYPILRPNSFNLAISFILLFWFLTAALFAARLARFGRVYFGVALAVRAGFLLALAVRAGFLIVF